MTSPWRRRFWVWSDPPNLLAGTLGGAGARPFAQTDWPNPQRPRQPVQADCHAANVQLIGQDRFFGAAGQVPAHEWPLPLRPCCPIQPDSPPSLLVGPLAVPFVQTDWPWPQRARLPQENQGFLRGSNVQLLGQDQFFASPGEAPRYDWPNPLLPRRALQPEPPPDLLTGALGTPVPVPFYQADWPNPQPARWPQENRGFLHGASIQLSGQDRFYGAPGEVPAHDWPLPPCARYPLQSDSRHAGVPAAPPPPVGRGNLFVSSIIRSLFAGGIIEGVIDP